MATSMAGPYASDIRAADRRQSRGDVRHVVIRVNRIEPIGRVRGLAGPTPGAREIAKPGHRPSRSVEIGCAARGGDDVASPVCLEQSLCGSGANLAFPAARVHRRLFGEWPPVGPSGM